MWGLRPALSHAVAVKHKLVSLGIILLSASVLAPAAALAQASVDVAPVDDDWLFQDSAELVDADPFEPANRALFGLNDILYRFVLDPVSDVYSLAVPAPGRRAVRRFFSNLSEPVVFVNQLLQGKCCWRAAATGGRFLINTTIGVAGLFDPATNWGLGRHPTGFGETLSVYSVGRGPYLVLPLLGPSTLRDAIGKGFDGFLFVNTWSLAASPRLTVAAGNGVSSYDARRDGMEALRNSSIDFYTALRTAYLLDRAAQLRAARRAPEVKNSPPDPQCEEFSSSGGCLRESSLPGPSDERTWSSEVSGANRFTR